MNEQKRLEILRETCSRAERKERLAAGDAISFVFARCEHLLKESRGLGEAPEKYLQRAVYRAVEGYCAAERRVRKRATCFSVDPTFAQSTRSQLKETSMWPSSDLEIDLTEAFTHLTKHERTMVNLRLQGYRINEIASQLMQNEHTTKCQWTRIRKQLRRILGAYHAN